MPTKFKSFEQLGQVVQEHGQKKIEEIFEQSVKDDFDSIPEGPLKSKLPEINWISFAHTLNKDTGQRKDSGVINAIISVKSESGRDKISTWSITKGGSIRPIQKLPPELAGKYDEKEIALELVSLLERISPSFIHLTDLDIIPTKDKGQEREDGDGDGGGGERPIDPERLEFFRSIDKASFISANRSQGLRGYMVIFFDKSKFLVVENEYKGNAAFIVDLPSEVDIEAIKEELSAKNNNQKISKEELRNVVVERYWKPISEKAKTRNQLRDLGAERIVHTSENWQEKMCQAIESRK